MRTRFVFAFVGVLGCTTSGPGSVEEPQPVTPTPQTQPDPQPEVQPDPEASGLAITVEMLAATLADECGGGPNTPPRARAAKSATKRDEGAVSVMAKSKRAERSCEQSSIQLAITATAAAEPAAVTVKSVELFRESGASLGKLEARAPSVWSEADGYLPWDQRIQAGQDLSVTYAITQPDWSGVKERRSESYRVEAVVSIGGEDQTVQQSVTIDAPTSLPPGVKT